MNKINPEYTSLLRTEVLHLMHYIESMNNGINQHFINKFDILHNGTELEEVQDNLLMAHDILKRVNILTKAK